MNGASRWQSARAQLRRSKEGLADEGKLYRPWLDWAARGSPKPLQARRTREAVIPFTFYKARHMRRTGSTPPAP